MRKIISTGGKGNIEITTVNLAYVPNVLENTCI